jgi:SAM-dependent methyltransferase
VRSEKFDLIFTDGLFEHFSGEEQHKIISNFKKVLSPQGIVATFVPNKWSPWQLIRPFFMPGIKEKPFTLQGLKDLNLRCGLEIIQSGGLNVLPFKYSPDRSFGPYYGMILFSLAKLRK